MNHRTRTAYIYGKQSPAYRSLGLFLLLLTIAWLAMLGLYDALMWVAEAIR